MADAPRVDHAPAIGRRAVLKLALAASVLTPLGGVLAACGGASSAPASPAGSSPASAAPAAKAAAAPASSGSAAPAAEVAENYKLPATWDELVAAGKAEGKVVVTGAPDADTRQKLPAAFTQKYGIQVDYLPGATEVTARLQAERAAGKYTLDVQVNGTDSIYNTLYANKWIDPWKDALMLVPENASGANWKAGKPWFRDPGEDTTLQIFSLVSINATINAGQVSPGDFPTADALLDPKWKGKICAFDPSANGAGLAIGAALYVAKGADYVTKLYKGQQAVLTRDYRQLADWLAHGSYPIGVAVPPNYLLDYEKAGLKFHRLQLPDAPNSVGGGFGIVAVMNKAPHPNAARVFANWIASKEGLTLYSQLQNEAPARSDIDPTWVPADLIPQPGVKYIDEYAYTFATTTRRQIQEFFQQMLK